MIFADKRIGLKTQRAYIASLISHKIRCSAKPENVEIKLQFQMSLQMPFLIANILQSRKFSPHSKEVSFIIDDKLTKKHFKSSNILHNFSIPANIKLI